MDVVYVQLKSIMLYYCIILFTSCNSFTVYNTQCICSTSYSIYEVGVVYNTCTIFIQYEYVQNFGNRL